MVCNRVLKKDEEVRKASERKHRRNGKESEEEERQDEGTRSVQEM